jgi:hypothetical protein
MVPEMVPIAYQEFESWLKINDCDAHQGMIATQRHRKYALSRVATDNTGNGSGHPGDSPRVLQLADRRVIQIIVLFKLVVSIKNDLPTQFPKLVYKTSFH